MLRLIVNNKQVISPHLSKSASLAKTANGPYNKIVLSSKDTEALIQSHKQMIKTTILEYHKNNKAYLEKTPTKNKLKNIYNEIYNDYLKIHFVKQTDIDTIENFLTVLENMILTIENESKQESQIEQLKSMIYA